MSNAHKTGRTEQIVARIPLEDAAALREQAKGRGLALSEAVKQAVRRWLGLDAPTVSVDRSPEIEALQARILELETQAAWFASKEEGWETQSRAAAEVIAKQAEEIADLKKQLARALRPPIPAKLALALRDGLTAPPPAAVGSLLKGKKA